MPPPAAVHGVADHGVPDSAQVHANLVGAAGDDRHADQRDAVEPLGQDHPGDCLARPPRTGRDALPVDRVAADRQIDAASLLHQAPDEGGVLLLHLAVRELARELGVRRVVLGYHDQSGGTAVEAVHDAGAEFTADAAQVAHMVQKRIDESAVRVAGGRMHDHARRLVDDDEIRVVVDDVEGQRLGPRRRRRRRRHVHPHHVAGVDGGSRARRRAVEQDVPLSDQLLDLRPGAASQLRSQELVESQAGVVGPHLEDDMLGRWRLGAVPGSVAILSTVEWGHSGSSWF